VLLHVDLQQMVSLEDLIALEASLDLSVEMDEAVNSQLFLHLEVNFALVAFELQLSLAVLVSIVLVIVPRGFA
jgi:hypothetical protein